VRTRGLLFPEIHRTAWEEFEVPDTPAAYDSAIAVEVQA
jgi:hypothetical protein